jgi:2-polyprenyl-6-methoxyphenol hydroxylase-like FAD-dependent oxidoreductase
MEKALHEHAVVVGGGIAGLLTARVLANHFKQVTVFEKDGAPTAPVYRKGTPQDRQLHIMNMRGEMVISKYFPGFYDEITEDIVHFDTEDISFFQYGTWKIPCKSKVDSHFISRSFIEYHVRRRLEAFENIHFFQENQVEQWLFDKVNNTVNGIRFKNKEGIIDEIYADLFVEASGRGSRVQIFLEESGYEKVEQEKIEINVAYIGQTFSRPQHEDFKAIFIFPAAPMETRMGIVLPIEGDRVHVSMAGYIGDHPTNSSNEGLLEFAKSLPRQDIYEAIRHLTAVSPVSTFRFPANIRKYYERMSKRPNNLIVIGDAICTFNPVYGQGMCVAALESEILDQVLISHTTIKSASRDYFKKIKPVITTAWQTATGEDLRYPTVKGNRSLIVKFSQWYLIQVFQLSSYNAKVCSAFFEVQTCIAKPTKLFSVYIILKVLQHSLGLGKKFTPILERPEQKSKISI